MPTHDRSPLVDAYLQAAPKWKAEMTALREIVSACGLDEDLKWGKPCFMYEGANIIVLAPFKEYCSLNFFKGALLRDEAQLYTPGNAQAARMLRFSDVDTITSERHAIEAYVAEAIEIERSGAEVPTVSREEVPYPEELLRMFEAMPAFRDAFEALTPGRRRGYLYHYADAKQSKTRTARIEKSMPKVFEGKGIFD